MFLSDLFHSFVNRLLLDNVIFLRKVVMKYMERGAEEEKSGKDVQVKQEA
jgi:hypothetical protein